MKRITENYEAELKDDLQKEADARELEVTGSGANGAITKDDLVLALQVDDECKVDDESNQPKPPLPKLKASPIPQVDKIPDAETGLDASAAPKDEDFTDGIFVDKGNGERYALCKHDPDGYGNTHTLKNSAHFWQGKEEDFNRLFSKE